MLFTMYGILNANNSTFPDVVCFFLKSKTWPSHTIFVRTHMYHIDEHAKLRQAGVYAQSLQNLLCSCSQCLDINEDLVQT